MIEKLKQFIKSKNFLYVLLALFVGQAVFFAAAINYKVPSDEEFHFTFTQYYANRPILEGPVIADQNSNFILGDVQRLPSYMYHYVSSFYLRAVTVFSKNIEVQVFSLRLLNVAIGLLCLLVLVRLLRRIGTSQLSINLVTAGLISTGMFVWVFAGITYDNLAMLLFLLLLHQLIGLQKKLQIIPLLLSASTALFLFVVKETYLPVVLLCFLLLFGWHLKQSGFKKLWKDLWKSTLKAWKSASTRRALVGVAILFLTTFGLFAERYIQNYVIYGKTTPSCNQVHSESECMQSSIYRRNTGQKKEFEAAKKAGDGQLESFGDYTRKWGILVYERTFFYRGHQTIKANDPARRVAGITTLFVAIIMSAGIWLGRGKRSDVLHKALGIITVGYILLVFFYNLNTYHYYGYPFAIQGRYLLPVLPFVYLAIVTCWQRVYRGLDRAYRPIYMVVTIGLIIINLFVHAPFGVYQRGHDILDEPVVSMQLIQNSNSNIS